MQSPIVDFEPAYQVKARTDSCKQTSLSKEIQVLKQAINIAAENGKYSVFVRNVSVSAKERLQQYGYTIRYNPGDPRDPGYEGYTISWKNEKC